MKTPCHLSPKVLLRKKQRKKTKQGQINSGSSEKTFEKKQKDKTL